MRLLRKAQLPALATVILPASAALASTSREDSEPSPSACKAIDTGTGVSDCTDDYYGASSSEISCDSALDGYRNPYGDPIKEMVPSPSWLLRQT